jgi:hypothetical protein
MNFVHPPPEVRLNEPHFRVVSEGETVVMDDLHSEGGNVNLSSQLLNYVG